MSSLDKIHRGIPALKVGTSDSPPQKKNLNHENELK